MRECPENQGEGKVDERSNRSRSPEMCQRRQPRKPVGSNPPVIRTRALSLYTGKKRGANPLHPHRATAAQREAEIVSSWSRREGTRSSGKRRGRGFLLGREKEKEKAEGV